MIRIFDSSFLFSDRQKMPLTGSTSATDIPTLTDQQEQQNISPTHHQNVVAVIRPIQRQSTAITIEHSQPRQQQPARAVSATSYTSEESEESLPDSLGEIKK